MGVIETFRLFTIKSDANCFSVAVLLHKVRGKVFSYISEMILTEIFIFGLVFVGCHGIFEDCDFYEELVPNRSYFIYSPEYPKKYPPGKSCRWFAVSPPNTKISLDCNEFSIPYSENCRLDRLSISRGGRIDLADVENYCGQGQIHLLSKKNKLNVALLTEWYSPGGSFFCEMAVKDDNPSPDPPPEPSCFCGLANRMRIVGGTETKMNEYPMMAGLIDGVRQELFCGATIISTKYALTAAHCLVNKAPRNVGLLVGEHDISSGSETDSSELYRCERFHLHPSYNITNQRNDAALVAVRGAIRYSKEVGPVCLPFLNRGNSFVGETVHALGWGSIEFLGPTSDKLLEAPLDVITLNQCRNPYGNLVWENQICTYREDKDACQSDSGGPLLWTDPNNGLLKILGIISYGVQCGTDYPSVNTRVTSYLDWIKSTTGEDYCVV